MGIYSKSYDLLLGPLSQVTAPLGGLMIPLLGRLRYDATRYRRAFTTAIMPANLCLIPFSAMMIVAPEKLVLVLLGSQWNMAAEVVTWFGPALAIQLFLSSAGWVLISQERGRDYAKVGAFSSACFLLSFALALPWGIAAVAAAYVACCAFFVMPAVFWFTGRQGPVRFSDFLSQLLLTVWCCAVVTGALVLWSKVEMPASIYIASGLIGGYCLLPVALGLLPQGRRGIRDTLSALGVI